MNPQEEAQSLRNQIREWDQAYYDDGSSPVSDAVYDAAKMRLQEIEAKTPELATEDSPTKLVGRAYIPTTNGTSKLAHHVPMLSLKTEVDTSVAPIEAFLKRLACAGVHTSISVEPKYDGLGLDLQYAQGKLSAAVTRGDGEIGEDVLQAVLYIPSIPKMLPKKLTIDIRGEVLLFRENFEKINTIRESEGQKLFSNCRNAAAGVMRLKDASPIHSFLDFYAYDIAWGDLSALGGGKNSHQLRMDFLQIAGFKVRYDSVNCAAMEVGAAAQELHNRYLSHEKDRSDCAYDIDGVVYKVNDIEARETLGFTGREPNWAIAHKFVPERAVTSVTAITLGVGKTGRITPVAQVQPVFVGGVTVTNVTLVHEERIRELGLSIGDKIEIQRAGDVIPEILRVVHEPGEQQHGCLDTKALFSKCPVCNSPLEKEGAFYYCTGGMNCSGQAEALLETAVSRAYLNIQGLGGQTVAKLYENGDLRDIADIFALTKEKLVKAEMSPLLVDEVLEHVNQARKHPLWRVMASIGIPHCGKTISKEIAKVYPNIAAFRAATAEDLQKIADLGPKTAANIVRSFANSDFYDRLQAVENSWSADRTVSNGKTVCVTGSLHGHTRESLKALLEERGYKTVDSVTKTTNLLIVGEGASQAKIDKANALDITIATMKIYSEPTSLTAAQGREQWNSNLSSMLSWLL